MRSDAVHGLLAVMLLAVCVVTSSAGAQGPSPEGPTCDLTGDLLRGRAVSDDARIRVEGRELLILAAPAQAQAQGASEQRLRLRLPPTLLQHLSRLRDRDFRTLAAQRPTPGGFAAGARLEDANGVVAIAEAIRDVPVLSATDRLGLEVRHLPGGQRTFVSETECQATHNVPAEVVAGSRRTIVRPGATETVQTAARPYRFTLVRSLLVVRKPCAQAFEGAFREIDYVLERE